MPSARKSIKKNYYMSRVHKRLKPKKAIRKIARSIAVSAARSRPVMPTMVAPSAVMQCKHLYSSCVQGTLGISGEVPVPPINTSVDKIWGFDANIMYDPNAMIGGHQPTNYDRMLSMFNRYRIIKARFKVGITMAVSNAIDLGQPLNYFVALGKESQKSSYVGRRSVEIHENKSITNKRISHYNCQAVPKETFISKWYTPKMLGELSIADVLVDASAQAAITTKAQFYFGFVQDTHLANSVELSNFSGGGQFTAIIQIEYWAEWSNPKLEPLN